MNIEHVYYEAQLSAFGVSLADFRANPAAVLRECGQETAVACMESGFRPLLPRQAMVAKRIQEQWQKEAIARKAAQLQPEKRRQSISTHAMWPAYVIPC